MTHSFEFSPELAEKLASLQKKLENDNQNLEVYLDKLIQSKYLSYWEYINLEPLLSLQRTQTEVHDEMIFVIFHQITELYFKLILFEIESFQKKYDDLNIQSFSELMSRLNHYLEYVASSFSLVSDVMKQEEFQKFRSALFPASGFQSYQYRMIEIASTDLFNLTDDETKENSPFHLSTEQSFQNLYWKKGATDRATGVGSLTLRMFEEKYSESLLLFSKKQESVNLWKCYAHVIEKEGESDELADLMRTYDHNFNIRFGLAHLKAAVNHLKNTHSTGGTNWQQYLPPKYQKTVFFPHLWSSEEIKNWGRAFLVEASS